MPLVIDVVGQEFIDPDALFVLDYIFDLLPESWQRSVKQDCEAGEEFWAVEIALQGAIETGAALSKTVLLKVEKIASNSDSSFAERLHLLSRTLD